jgi:hypothetical protein
MRPCVCFISETSAQLEQSFVGISRGRLVYLNMHLAWNFVSKPLVRHRGVVVGHLLVLFVCGLCNDSVNSNSYHIALHDRIINPLKPNGIYIYTSCFNKQ